MAIKTDEFKTKTIVNMLNALNVEGKALIVLDTNDKKVIKSAANIPGVNIKQYNTRNVYDILNYNKFVDAKDAVAKIQDIYE